MERFGAPLTSEDVARRSSGPSGASSPRATIVGVTGTGIELL